MAFLTLSTITLKSIFLREEYKVLVTRAGDNSVPLETIGKLTLLDYMTQSDTRIKASIFKEFGNKLSSEEIAVLVQQVQATCGQYSIYLSYLFEGKVTNDYMSCTALSVP